MYICMHVCEYLSDNFAIRPFELALSNTASDNAYTYTYIHTHIRVKLDMLAYECIYVCMYTCMNVYMYVCIHVCMYICMYVHMCVWIRTFESIHTYGVAEISRLLQIIGFFRQRAL